jgi:threonine aldolase
MRQCGVLAAAAHVALDGAEQRIRADHDNAKMIVKGLNSFSQLDN